MAEALANAGHQVRVLGLQRAGDLCEAFKNENGVSIWRLKAPQTTLVGWILGRRILFRKIAEWVRNQQVDLLEIPDFEGIAAYWPKLDVPIVARLHGSSTYFAAELANRNPRLTYLLERASLRRADFCCAVSRYTAEQTRSEERRVGKEV